jgi:hypothetical protein
MITDTTVDAMHRVSHPEDPPFSTGVNPTALRVQPANQDDHRGIAGRLLAFGRPRILMGRDAGERWTGAAWRSALVMICSAVAVLVVAGCAGPAKPASPVPATAASALGRSHRQGRPT